jgi:GTPase Era involved in 16S rRNA processing
VAVIGIQGSGKSGLIQRICTDVFSNTPHSETEQQSTALWKRAFFFFWEFPPDQLNTATVEQLLIGFGAVLFTFDLRYTEGVDFERSQSYLTELMTHPRLVQFPYVLVGTKFDLIPDYHDVRPAMVMNALTEKLKKTQLILSSAKTGVGLPEILEWLNSHAVGAPTSEADIDSCCSFPVSS